MKKVSSLESKNDVLKRIIGFMNDHGGVAPVARMVGKNEQTFRSMISRDTKPSVDLLLDFAGVFEDFDVNYIVTGKNKSAERIKRLEEKLEIQEEVVARLVGKPEATTKSLLVDDETEAERASDIFTTPPFQSGVISTNSMWILVELYGVNFNPSLD